MAALCGAKDFRTTAPGQWDAAAMPVMGSAAARPGKPDSVVTEWSVDPDDWGEFLCTDIRSVVQEGSWKGAGQLVRVAGGPMDEQARSDMHTGAGLRKGDGDD